MADILADVPENVMDLYRDKPAAEGGILYGLPPDSNCQLQYYRTDILEQAGIDGPAETWDEAIEIAKTLAESGTKQTGTTLKRGLFAGTVFITILRSYGGDWFDKMEPGVFNPALNTEAGHSAMQVLLALQPYLEDSSLNASDDESNPAMANGTWTYAPAQWGGTTMNDPEFTEYLRGLGDDSRAEGQRRGRRSPAAYGRAGHAHPGLLEEQGRGLGVREVLLLRRQAGSRYRQGLGRGDGPTGSRLAAQGVRAAARPLPGHPGVAADGGSLPADPGDVRAL